MWALLGRRTRRPLDGLENPQSTDALSNLSQTSSPAFFAFSLWKSTTFVAAKESKNDLLKVLSQTQTSAYPAVAAKDVVGSKCQRAALVPLQSQQIPDFVSCLSTFSTLKMTTFIITCGFCSCFTPEEAYSVKEGWYRAKR